MVSHATLQTPPRDARTRPGLALRPGLRLAYAVALVVLLGLDSGPAEAAPTITGVSGPAAHGATVTVSGSGFGTKPTAAPLKYDDFEGGALGALIANGWHASSQMGFPPIYSNTIVRPNSTRSVRSRFINGEYNSSFGLSNQTLQELYIDAWYYFDSVAPYSRNHKPFRLHNGSQGQPNLYYGFWCQGQGASIIAQDGVSGGTTGHWMADWLTIIGARQWAHFQLYIRESTPGVDDGVVWFAVNNAVQLDNRPIRTRNVASDTWDMVLLGNYTGHEADSSCAASGDQNTYWDNVYVDTSRARVEIGNGPTYATSTHREVQIPSAWAAGSITVTVNAGSFGPLDTLFLYVVDASGAVNTTGFSVSMTGQSPPAPPTGLRVQ